MVIQDEMNEWRTATGKVTLRPSRRWGKFCGRASRSQFIYIVLDKLVWTDFNNPSIWKSLQALRELGTAQLGEILAARRRTKPPCTSAREMLLVFL
jgi:hypothetical protein